MRQRVTGQALIAILAHNSFIACPIYNPYNFIVSLIRLSLSSTAFQFLLCLNQSSRAIYPTYQAARATPTRRYSSSPFPRSSSISFRISISFYYFQSLSFSCYSWVAPYQVYCSIAFSYILTHLRVYCDPPIPRRLSGYNAYIKSRACYAVDLIRSGYFFIG